MSNTDDSTPTPQETLYAQLNQASLKLTYAKSLAGLVSNEAQCSADRILSIESEGCIHALSHALKTLVEEANEIISAVDLQIVTGKVQP